MNRRRQRGVALITAVLIVALATVLAVNVGFNGYLDQRRTANVFALDQSFEVALGGEAWAADALRRDKQQGSGNQTDDFTEAWATPIPPIPLEDLDGEFEGRLEDLQGRFNINNLLKYDGGVGVADQAAVERLQRLLEILELEPKWAKIIADWIDTDGNPEFPDGAEDTVYTGLTPPYRTANMPVTRTSELLALPDFGIERFRKLEPFITALPAGTPINLCTASPELLDALMAGSRQFSSSRESTKQTREQRCFPNLDEFARPLGDAGKKLQDDKVIDTKSDYFLATIWVTLGTHRYTLYSLLYRPNGGTNQVRPILRSHGTL